MHTGQQYGRTENAHLIHNVPLHYVKIYVWCSLSGGKIMHLMFYIDAIHSEGHVIYDVAPVLLWLQLAEYEKQKPTESTNPVERPCPSAVIKYPYCIKEARNIMKIVAVSSEAVRIYACVNIVMDRTC
jgi:hypothetical protein